MPGEYQPTLVGFFGAAMLLPLSTVTGSMRALIPILGMTSMPGRDLPVGGVAAGDAVGVADVAGGDSGSSAAPYGRQYHTESRRSEEAANTLSLPVQEVACAADGGT